MSGVRVLHIVGTMARGGAESWLMSLLREADSDKIQMEFCVVKQEKGVYAQEIESLESNVHVCPLKPFYNFPRRFSKLLKDGNYDVVHSHVWLFSGLILKIAAKCKVAVRVAHSHNSQADKKKSFFRWIYKKLMGYYLERYSTHKLACAFDAAKALYGSEWESDPKCKILYCSIDTSKLKSCNIRALSREELCIPNDAVVIGNVGNLRKQKNHTFMLDIASEFLKLVPDAYFFVAGEGNLRKELEAKANALGISDHVRFAGVRNDVSELLVNIFDAFLFPSLYEGMPLTLIEATCAGLNTVCSDTITTEATDVCPELFTRLSLNDSAKIWAQSLKESVDKPRMPHEKAWNIVEKSHFSTNYCLKELINLYSSDKKEG